MDGVEKSLLGRRQVAAFSEPVKPLRVTQQEAI